MEKQANGGRAGKEEPGAGSRLVKFFTWDKKLLPVKLILFLFSGGASSFLPFLTLHMQQLGITVKEIAIIYAFLPIASLLGPPISGLIADKFGKYQTVLSFNIVTSLTLHLMLLYVPPRTTNTLTLGCSPGGSELTWGHCSPCHATSPNLTHLALNLTKCRYECDAAPEELTLCTSLGCQAFNLTDTIPLNGSLTSWRRVAEEDTEEDICGHHLHHLHQSQGNLTCPSAESGCRVECEVEGFPPCLHPQDSSNAQNTFWIYFALRMLGTFFLASSFTMLDATVLAVVKQHNVEFGKQRVLTTVGQATVPILTSIAVDRYSASLGYTDYTPALYLGAGLAFLTPLLIIRLRVEVEVAGKHLLRDLRALVTRLEIDLFLLMVLIMGSNWGFIESYLFVYLRHLGAPNYLLGLTLTVGCLCGIPVMYMADTVVEKMGRPTIFIISFFTYTIRHLGYAFITDPWMVFPFELLEVFTYQIMWVAACTYCPLLAPRGLLATMTGLTGSIHYSLGRGVGALGGGYLIANYGLALTFRIFAGISFVSGIAYTCLHFFYLRHRIAESEAEREREMAEEVGDGEGERGEERNPMLERRKQALSILSTSLLSIRE